MYNLIIDASTKYLLVAITKNNKLLKIKYRIAKKDHAFYITQFIHELLKECNLEINNIKDITVGKGPGSYTGLRVAATCAKVFSYTRDIKLYSISSLFLLTSGYKEAHLAYYDARNERYFASLISKNNIILKDSLYNKYELDFNSYTNCDLTSLNLEDIIKIDYELVFLNRKLEDNILFSPNYCLKSKAERDLNDCKIK